MGDVQVAYAKISFHSHANETHAPVNNCAPLQGWKNVLSSSPGQVVFLAGQVTFIAQLTNGQESGKSFSNKIIN